MIIKDILDLVVIKSLFRSKTDDWIDRLNHSYTVTILVIFAVTVLTSEFVGDPIHCWTPAEFDGAWVAYTKSYCWIKNTYFLPMDDEIPVNIAVRSDAEITYYQWTPLILLFMAFMFKLPNVLWKLMNTHTGFNFRSAEKIAVGAMEDKNGDDYDAAIRCLAKFIDTWIRAHRYYELNMFRTVRAKLSHVLCMYCNKREGKYLSALYYNIKVLYMINVIAQFYILNAFLGMDFSTYGYEILGGLSEGENWKESPRFPKITLCDFEIRQLQNIQRWTVQCVLPINLFNEKIFIFLWFWLFLVAVLSGFNLVKWSLILIIRKNNRRFLNKYLKLQCKLHDHNDKKLAFRFSNYYLRDDGCFVLRIIGMNTSDVIVFDLVNVLWEMYKEVAARGRVMALSDSEKEGLPYADADPDADVDETDLLSADTVKDKLARIDEELQ